MNYLGWNSSVNCNLFYLGWLTDDTPVTPVFARGGWPLGVFYAEWALRS